MDGEITLYCHECGRTWKVPCGSAESRCPRCQSSAVVGHACNVCGHIWSSRIIVPNACPKCHSPNWAVFRYLWHCLQCGAVWRARGIEAPHICPTCKSPHYRSYEIHRLSKYATSPEGAEELKTLYSRIRRGDPSAGDPIWFSPICDPFYQPGDKQPLRGLSVHQYEGVDAYAYLGEPVYRKRMKNIEMLDRFRARPRKAAR